MQRSAFGAAKLGYRLGKENPHSSFHCAGKGQDEGVDFLDGHAGA
jgi:hypothetical protein